MDMEDASDFDFEIYSIKVHELVEIMKSKSYETYVQSSEKPRFVLKLAALEQEFF